MINYDIHLTSFELISYPERLKVRNQNFMTNAFLQHVFDKQQLLEDVPPNEAIAGWATRLISLLFPERSDNRFDSVENIESEFYGLRKELTQMLNATKACCDCNNEAISHQFFDGIAELYRMLNTDVDAILSGDPAAKTEFEVIRAYPGFFALSFYRVAHLLLILKVPLIPRILTEFAHSRTGIDIHPGARIGEYCMIDHGTGAVIGETTIIGNHVKIYQGVTLGALSVDKSMASVKRHPTIGDHVILYSNATVLGGDTLIGSHSVIGGNVWLTNSVPPGSLVYHNPEVTVLEGKTLMD
jgi:serine O-acetyltransferase